MMALVTRRGFSILETIVAGAILSVLMMIMFNLFPNSLLAIRRAEHRIEATSMAQAILEQKRAGGFSDLINPPPGMVPVAGDDGVIYTPAYSPQQVSPGLMRLRVTISWTERNVTRSVYQEILVADTSP